MRILLIFLSLIVIGGCKYPNKKALMSNSVDTLLYYQLDNYVEESRYENDLSKIRSEVNLKIDSIKMLLKNNTTLEGKHFHIIVGSFGVEKNAINYAQKMKNSGFEGNIITGRNSYQMVTTKSYNNLRIALDELAKIRESVTDKAWVYISR